MTGGTQMAPTAGAAEKGAQRRRRPVLTSLGVLALALPVLTALLGPFLAPALTAPDGAPYTLGDGHPLGTDGTGRDVLGLLLRGGGTALGVATGAVLGAYLIGGALGLIAATTRHRLLDELLLRPVEILLPLPSLLVISVVAVWWRGHPLSVALAVAVINVPAVARLTRTAALTAAHSPVVEAMRLQGESRARIVGGHVGRAVLPVAAADAGNRVTAAVFTVAAANFLGLGMEPTAPDWAVTIAAGREGLMLQPLAVCAPAAMLVLFTVGLNLTADAWLRRAGLAAGTSAGGGRAAEGRAVGGGSGARTDDHRAADVRSGARPVSKEEGR